MIDKNRLSLVKGSEGTVKFNSFFAGIGGFDLGFQSAGISPAFHCEINDFCNNILRRHWPEVPHSTDIRALSPSDLPDADVWCGGFPCQDVSLARSWRGREGLNGKNSGLFYPFYELIKSRLPQTVIFENVTGLLSSHSGTDFRIILESLIEIGYSVAWRVVNTRYFGSPQSRPRVFIAATLGDSTRAVDILYEREKTGPTPNSRAGFLTESKCKLTGAIIPEVGYCLAATSGRHTGTDWSRTYISYADSVRRLTPTECEGLQGFPNEWTLPSADYKYSDDEIDTLRYHALGNAVSVKVVEWIGRRLVKTLNPLVTYSKLLDVNKEDFLHRLTSVSEEFAFSKNRRVFEWNDILVQEDLKWNSGGFANGTFLVDFPASPAPNDIIDSKLIAVVEKRSVDKKYFLSPNAAEGILRRVNSQNRTLFNPLYKALLALSGKKVSKSNTTLGEGSAEAEFCAKTG